MKNLSDIKFIIEKSSNLFLSDIEIRNGNLFCYSKPENIIENIIQLKNTLS